MSQASMLAFIQRLASDQAFAKKIMAAPDVGTRIRLAAAEGYEVSAEELAAQGQKLGDTDLDAVAGAGTCGTNYQTCIILLGSTGFSHNGT